MIYFIRLNSVSPYRYIIYLIVTKKEDRELKFKNCHGIIGLGWLMVHPLNITDLLNYDPEQGYPKIVAKYS